MCVRDRAERAHAVDQTEVHSLGVTTLFRRDLCDWNTEDVCGGCLVNVEAFRERVQ